MYSIKTDIFLRVIGRTKRWLYNQTHGYYDRNMKYHPQKINRDDLFVVMERGKQVSYITQKGIEDFLRY
jgi:hypothetical protein